MDHVEPILLSAYLDDEVSADEREHVERHLAGCDACRGELQGLRATAALLRLLPEAPLPRTFYVTEAMVAPAPRATESWWQRLMPRLAPLGAVAAMLLVVVMGAQLFMGGMGAPAAAPAADAEPEIAVSMATEAPAGDVAIKAPESDTAPVEEPGDGARVIEEPADEENAAMALPEPTEAAAEPGANAEMAEPTAEAAAEAPAPDDILVDPATGPVEPPAPFPDRAGGSIAPQPGGGEGESAAASGPSPLINVAAGFLLLALLLLALRFLLYRRRAP